MDRQAQVITRFTSKSIGDTNTKPWKFPGLFKIDTYTTYIVYHYHYLIFTKETEITGKVGEQFLDNFNLAILYHFMPFHFYPKNAKSLEKSLSQKNNNTLSFRISVISFRLFLFCLRGACLNVCDQWYCCFNGTTAHLKTISHTIRIHRILNGLFPD